MSRLLNLRETFLLQDHAAYFQVFLRQLLLTLIAVTCLAHKSVIESDVFGEHSELAFGEDHQTRDFILHLEHALLNGLHQDLLLVVPDLDDELAVHGHSVDALSEEASRYTWIRHQVKLVWLLLHLLAE